MGTGTFPNAMTMPDAPAPTPDNPSADDRLIAMAVYMASALGLWILAPIVILLWKRDRAFIVFHAAQSLALGLLVAAVGGAIAWYVVRFVASGAGFAGVPVALVGIYGLLAMLWVTPVFLAIALFLGGAAELPLLSRVVRRFLAHRATPSPS